MKTINNIIKNAIYIIAIISISLSMYFAINIQLSSLPKEELFYDRVYLSICVFISMIIWISTEIKKFKK